MEIINGVMQEVGVPSGGGTYIESSINVETLSGTKTLVVTDLPFQWLDPDGSDRDVNLPAEADSTNQMFIILNTANGAGEDLVVKDDSPATIATLGPGMMGIFHCDGSNWLWENESGIFYDAVSGNRGIGTTEPDTILQIKNDNWFSAKNFAGTAALNMLKVNVSDEIEVGGTINLGSIEATEDSGAVTLADMPVSATPAALTEESFTIKIDGDNVLTIGAFADNAGGVTGRFTKSHGAQMVSKIDSGGADYNPSILTSDYIITVDTTAAARAVIISAEDKASGSATRPRIFIIKDIAGNAGTNNITVSLETAGTIDGSATYVINANYDSITLMVDGTNGHII